MLENFDEILGVIAQWLKLTWLSYCKPNVYCRRPGPYDLLNERYREPTHDGKH